MPFPICRHGEELSTPGLRQCHSPKLVGMKIVSPAQCQRCFCRDHEPTISEAQPSLRLLRCAHLGEALREAAGLTDDHSFHETSSFACHHPDHSATTLQGCQSCPDYLFPMFTRNMPAEMVLELLSCPVRKVPEDWARWNNVQSAHRLAANQALQRIPSWTGQYSGRGIVVVGGGRYFVSAYVTIRVLRHLGCQLPVELWHLDGEITPDMRQALAPWNVRCMNANTFPTEAPFRFLHGHWWKGWQLKAFALRYCSFREVLMLDSDSYPVRNPEFLFEWPTYREWGSIFWPDLKINSGMVPKEAWEIFGVEPFHGLPTESGQMLVNKELCWREIHLALHYNAHADFVYRILYGDKDTFPMAWSRLGRRYGRLWPESRFESVAIQQLDDTGELLFIHRVHDKFRLPDTTFNATPQQTTSNKFHPDFPLEQFCFDCVHELLNSGYREAK